MTLLRKTSLISILVDSYAVAAGCSSLAQCIDFASLNATFLNSTHHAAGAPNILDESNNLPICEVYASISYGSTGNSSLIFALWLFSEQADYLNRCMAVGNGGMAGTIDKASMLTQLNSGFGFAVAGGDAGHSASENNDSGGELGVNVPYLHDDEQMQAWIHDAISLFTLAARAVTGACHGKEPEHSYYVGCSTGGAQEFALAQFHPELFGGVVVGFPVNWYSHLALSFLWNAQATNASAPLLDQGLLNLTTNAVLDACNMFEGVEDRLIEDPLQCDFNINTLACKTSDSEDTPCLTDAQVAAVKSIYASTINANTGAQIYPGFSSCSEIEWLL